MLLRLACALGVAAVLLGVTLVAPAAAQEERYVVQPGDTLGEIARRFGVSVERLAAANGIPDPDFIRAGRALSIPSAGEDEGGTGGPDIYVVQPGDTLPMLAQRFRTPAAEIARVNNLAEGEPLQAGRTLIIPGGQPDDRLLQVVNRGGGLPPEYVPANLVPLADQWEAPGFPGQSLRAEAADALYELLAAARAEGHELRVRSSYRSYGLQEAIFADHARRLGVKEASRFSAPPGHSQHQLGTAVDLTTAEVNWALTERLADTAAGRWLGEHAHEYGFALPYPPGQEATSGYRHEPWHYRYIGRDHAQAWHDSGLVLIEYLLRVQQAGSSPSTRGDSGR